ncbi:MAG: hypothetical protein HY898_24310 [Deltaproteobacteria bacterium]|nr:hypothetical protein [Deltaproteobacteria bacterium]
MNRARLAIILASFTSLLAMQIACGSNDASVNPAPIPSSPSTDSGVPTDGAVQKDAPVSDTAPDQEAEAGPVVRTIMMRSPFGELDPTNMLHDGDFELSGLNGMQYPWAGTTQELIQTGAACRSGLRCVLSNPGEPLMGSFVWPDAPYAEISFYGAITTDSCETEGVGLLIRLDDYNSEPIRILPTTPNPVDGWCHFGMTVEVDTARHWWSLWLAARSKAEGPVVFDQASMRGTTTAPTNLRSKAPLPADVHELLVSSRDKLRKLLPPNPPREPRPVGNPTGRGKALRTTAR